MDSVFRDSASAALRAVQGVCQFQLARGDNSGRANASSVRPEPESYCHLVRRRLRHFRRRRRIDPVALQASPFSGQGFSFMGSAVHTRLTTCLPPNTRTLLQVPWCLQNPPPGFGFSGRLAVVHGQREALVFHPYARAGPSSSSMAAFHLRTWRRGLRAVASVSAP